MEKQRRRGHELLLGGIRILCVGHEALAASILSFVRLAFGWNDRPWSCLYERRRGENNGPNLSPPAYPPRPIPSTSLYSYTPSFMKTSSRNIPAPHSPDLFDATLTHSYLPALLSDIHKFSS
jgi:hypothetical protein